MKFSERLSAARNKAGLSQDKLAELVGMKQPSVAYLENPSKNAKESEFTVRIARACGVSVDWLADEIGEMCPEAYTTTDPKIIAAAKVMEPLPEYGKDAAVEDITKVAQLIIKATGKGNGTDG